MTEKSDPALFGNPWYYREILFFCGCARANFFQFSGQNFFDHVAEHVGEAEIPALEAVGQAFVVQA